MSKLLGRKNNIDSLKIHIFVDIHNSENFFPISARYVLPASEEEIEEAAGGEQELERKLRKMKDVVFTDDFYDYNYNMSRTKVIPEPTTLYHTVELNFEHDIFL